jgi:hypothetical protein
MCTTTMRKSWANNSSNPNPRVRTRMMVAHPLTSRNGRLRPPRTSYVTQLLLYLMIVAVPWTHKMNRHERTSNDTWNDSK